MDRVLQLLSDGDIPNAHFALEQLHLEQARRRTGSFPPSPSNSDKKKMVDAFLSFQGDLEIIDEKIYARVHGETPVPVAGDVGRAPVDLDILKKERAEKRVAYNSFLLQIRKKNPEIGVILGAKPVELRKIQEMLPPDVAILQYLVLEERTVIFVIRRDQIEIVEVPVRAKRLENLIVRLRTSIGSPLGNPSQGSLGAISSELYDFLIEPVERRGYLKGIHIIGFAPNRILHLLPFSILSRSSSENLLDKYEIFLLNSTSLLSVALPAGDLQKTSERSLLAIGNPDGSLRYSGEEVGRIMKYFNVGKAYMLEEAKKSVLLKEVEHYSVVHLSMHAQFNPTIGTKSYLQMADSRLTLEEIWGMPMDNVTLTVLSACETGLGEAVSGDEIISLENAFFFAGSSSVLATLWKISDHATSEFMDVFYKNYQAGNSKSASLSIAQRAIKKKYPAPFYWAGFTLRGSWR